jgi:hypothetical protein
VIRVENEDTLREALDAPRAILVLHAEWSMPSVLVLGAVRQWESELHRRTQSLAVPMFLAMNGDAYPPPVVAWLEVNGLESFTCSGWGEVLWLERGRIIAEAHGRESVTPVALTRRTIELWGPGEVWT